MNLGELLADSRSSRAALEFNGTSLSYQELDDSSNQLANWLLRSGLQPQDRVSMLMTNDPRMVIAYFGIFKAGIVAHPLNSRLKPRELSAVCEHADSRLIVTTGEHVEALAQLSFKGERTPPVLCFAPPPDARVPLIPASVISEHPASSPQISARSGDEALLVYTSGTSGAPKGVLLTHGNLIADASGIVATLRLDSSHRTLCFMPLSHVNALVFSHLSSFLAGGTVVLAPRFSATDHWRSLSELRINSFSCPPTVLAILLERDSDGSGPASALRYIKVGSAPLSPSLADRFESRFGELLLEGYGLTEATCTNTLNPVAGMRKRGSVGKALPEHRLKVVDEAGRAMTGQLVGELLIQGPTVMKGYFRDTDASRRAVRDGWLHTGDLALMDQDGYVSLVGRKKDIIVRGGENMVPQEIEEVLRCHSHVKDAAVIGAPDSIWGEVVTAFVIPDGPLRAEDLVEFCRPLLADFKLPQRIVQVDQLPRNEAGKVQREVLRDMLQDMSEDGRGR